MRNTKKNEGVRVIDLIEKVVKSVHRKDIKSIELKIGSLEDELSQLSKEWGVSNESCFFLCLIFEYVMRFNSCSIDHLIKSLNADIFQILKYDYCFSELVSSGYINKTHSSYRDGISYKMPAVVLQRLINGQTIQRSEIKGLTNVRFYRHLRNQFTIYEARSINFEEVLISFKNLFELNPDLPLPSFAKDHNLEWEDIFVLICIVDGLWNEGEKEFSLRSFIRKYDKEVYGSDIYFQDDEDEETLDFNQVKKELTSGESKLITLGVLTPARKEEYKTILTFEITSKFVDIFFKDVDLLLGGKTNHLESEFFKVINHVNIPAVKLVYDAEVQNEVDSLRKLLREEHFVEMTKRQSELNLPTNVIGLIAGPSGSGKTSLVREICREVNRNLIIVSLSSLKSSYFGETNKLIQSLFDEFGKIYETHINDGDKLLPVILIDECESLFSDRRKYDGKTSIETLLQEIVGLILTNLDGFKGILLLTSNYPERMDGALNRRIPFKFHIPLPSKETRKSILQNELGEWLQCAEINSLSEFNLSGSNIRTIKQRSVNHYIINGNYPELRLIERWCQSEVDGFNMCTKKIGF